jgi:hypothetical protein
MSSASSVGAPPLGSMPCARTLTCCFAPAERLGKPLSRGKLNGLPDLICAPLAVPDPEGAGADGCDQAAEGAGADGCEPVTEGGLPLPDEDGFHPPHGASPGTGAATAKPSMAATRVSVFEGIFDYVCK